MDLFLPQQWTWRARNGIIAVQHEFRPDIAGGKR